MIDVDDLVAYLNRLYTEDPRGMELLIHYAVNWPDPEKSAGVFNIDSDRLSVLGMLNGLLNRYTVDRVAARYDGRGRLLGFCRV